MKTVALHVLALVGSVTISLAAEPLLLDFESPATGLEAPGVSF